MKSCWDFTYSWPPEDSVLSQPSHPFYEWSRKLPPCSPTKTFNGDRERVWRNQRPRIQIMPPHEFSSRRYPWGAQRKSAMASSHLARVWVLCLFQTKARTGSAQNGNAFKASVMKIKCCYHWNVRGLKEKILTYLKHQVNKPNRIPKQFRMEHCHK